MKPYLSARQERGGTNCRCCPDKAERGRGRRSAWTREVDDEPDYDSDEEALSDLRLHHVIAATAPWSIEP